VAELGQLAFASSIIATAEMICPEVQKPHWKPSRSMDAAWSGWSWPSRSTPSMVVMRLPSSIADKVMHDSPRRSSTCTVHVPHSPRSHPYLCAGQRRFFTQCVKQRHARFDHDRADTTVDSHAHGYVRGFLLRRFCGGIDAFASGVAFDVGRLELLILRCLQLIFFTQWAAGFAGQKPYDWTLHTDSSRAALYHRQDGRARFADPDPPHFKVGIRDRYSRKTKSQVACARHLKPAAMRGTDGPHQDAIAMSTP
jgi:hypothetical protein